MLRSTTFLLLFATTTTLPAQHWVDLLMDETTNIHDVKAAFDTEWEGRTYVRGKGWKQFQRWHWFMEQRTWPSGERPDPAIHLQAAQQVRQMHAQRGGLRDGAEWRSLGPTQWNTFSYNPGNGRVNCVALDPQDPEIIYAGTPSGGLWRYIPGTGWEALFTDLPSMGVSGIAIHPDDPQTIFIATGDGDGADTYSAGVLKTNDGGQTWESTGLDWNINQTRTTRALRMHQNDPDVMYCAASSGLYSTTDGGANWTQHSGGSFRDVEFMPGDTTIVYACGTSFYRSEPGGGNFSNAGITGLPSPSQVGRMAIAVTPADPLIVYALCSNNQNGFLGLYRSTDGGHTFETRSTSPNLFGYSEVGDDPGGQAWYDMALAVDTENPDLVYVGGINVWRSNDGGANWNIVSHWVYPSMIGYTHADIHSLDVLDGKIWCGSDGGIFVSANTGNNWQNRSFGLDITQFYRIGGSASDAGLLLGGAQDNGTNRLKDGQWTHIFGADGMECAVDRASNSILYGAYQNGGLLRSNNEGVSWTGLTDNIDDQGAWVTPYVLHPTDPTVLVAGFRNLWVSADRGDNWYQTTFWPTGEFVRVIAIAPSDPDVWFAARNDRVMRSIDGGFTWTSIKPGLPNLSPTSIAVDHDDPMHVWITFSGQTGGQKVYESVNGGGSWINRSLGLPNVPANSIVTQPDSPNGVYLGTDMGVFYRDDYTEGWELYGNGLPNVVVTELEVHMGSGTLRAGTYGRGIWEADLYFSPFASVDEIAITEGPLVMPADMEGRYIIRADERLGRLLEVRVFDAVGRAIRPRMGQRDLHQLDLSAQPPGTYLVHITMEKGMWTRPVVARVW